MEGAVSAPQRASSIPAYNIWQFGGIEYLGIPLRKFHINASAEIHYLLCCDKSFQFTH